MPPDRIERILVPTDFSVPSLEAFALALSVGSARRGSLLVLHVCPPATPGDTSAAVAPDDPRLQLAHLVATARARGLSADGVVAQGDTVQSILDRASSWHADIVVMGTEGRRTGRAWGLGSVAARVLQRSRCPVLMVGSSHLEGTAATTPPLRRILCPTDFSDASRLAFEYGAGLAAAFGARITPLHVLESCPGSGDAAHLYVPEYQMDVAQETRERLGRSIPESARPFCVGSGIVALGRPHREIVRVARERAIDLIVLGVHDRRAIDRALGGSTLGHVVRAARCPVLAVRVEPPAAIDRGVPATTRRAS